MFMLSTRTPRGKVTEMESQPVENPRIKKARAQYGERISISNAATEKLMGWIEQANAKKQALNLSPKSMVNWLLESAPDELTNAQLKDLAERFYDEVKFLQTALMQMKQAKARGEKLSLDDLMHAQAAMVKPEKRSGEPRLKKAKVAQESSDKNSEVSCVNQVDGA